MKYRVGTRGSKLAIAQTQYVIDRLKASYPEDEYEIVVMQTTGDKKANTALDAIGGKGVFVDTIEAALLEDEIQLAVHSMKDMPEVCAPGLTFAKAWEREDQRDVLILREAASLRALRPGAIIATGSKRRAYQLLKLRPDLTIIPIRGNVDTRIRKLHEVGPDGKMPDGIILAAAGLKRLGREAEITQYLSVSEMIPAPAQGTLAIELREENTELLKKVNALHDPETESAVELERAVLKKVGATCHDTIGAHAQIEGSECTLHVIYGSEKETNAAVAVVKGNYFLSDPVESALEEIRKNLKEGDRSWEK